MGRETVWVRWKQKIDERSERVFLSPKLLVLLVTKVCNISKQLPMDLKTFVKESLIQIDEALAETSERFTQYSYKYWRNNWGNLTIDFEVQVYASEWTWTTWWAWISVAWWKLWMNWESKNSNYEQSKISFSVVRENTPEQDKTEMDQKNKVFPTRVITRKVDF